MMTNAAMRRVGPPTPEELVGRARDMVPEIRALAEETERNRNISPHVIAKIRDAELLRTTRPKEFGGFEYHALVALEIALVISAACASTGWAVNGALPTAFRSAISRSRRSANYGATAPTRSAAPALPRPAPRFRRMTAMC
jgi:alkylation response protein AidB-like acyl-CoA dehydrogenase